MPMIPNPSLLLNVEDGVQLANLLLQQKKQKKRGKTISVADSSPASNKTHSEDGVNLQVADRWKKLVVKDQDDTDKLVERMMAKTETDGGADLEEAVIKIQRRFQRRVSTDEPVGEVSTESIGLPKRASRSSYVQIMSQSSPDASPLASGASRKRGSLAIKDYFDPTLKVTDSVQAGYMRHHMAPSVREESK